VVVVAGLREEKAVGVAGWKRSMVFCRTTVRRPVKVGLRD
jgi:hypothetical protein